ncbi:uncharacterized protein (DUF983 family) [Sphingobium sp. OAS761]|uniref:DUF983 domain-containing protein n=1 Tax=Sphingobium sp. OAS761 TaxID=2817901 RepID=UPI0020A00028|nr:DUF983 domain-containing protein [Sphingobium sp. OAS761]MCP1471834.1 uncharacterized protein (DUF983 family) [Sphingobium sp. OAS761]
MTVPSRSDPAPLFVASARGACPQCGSPSLFDGVVRFAPACRLCGLDYDQFNVGDGPAAFLTLIIGALMVALALALEFGVHPPVWVHILLWPILTTVAVVYSLRVAKGALLILEYRNRAREGRLADKGNMQP